MRTFQAILIVACAAMTGCVVPPPAQRLAVEQNRIEQDRTLAAPEVAWVPATRRGAALAGGGYQHVLSPDRTVTLRETAPMPAAKSFAPIAEPHAVGGAVRMEQVFAAWRRFCDRSDELQPSDVQLIRSEGLIGDQSRPKLGCDASTE